MTSTNQNYYLPDGGGIVYPYVANDNWNHQFRTEVVLDEPVDLDRVRRALELLRPEFPSFFVTLGVKKSLYVLERTDKLPEIVPEVGLCRTFDLTSKDHALFRITYAGRRLGMEVFHSLADGAGANVFFARLLAEYFTLCGETIDRDHPIFSHGAGFIETDTEDSFRRVHDEQGGNTVSRSEPPAYQYNGGRAEIPLRLTEYAIPFPGLKAAAKDCGASITVFLAAAYTKALSRVCLEEGRRANSRNIKIEVPMDMRKRFGSTTVRNFSLYFDTNISAEDGANRSLAELVEMLKPQFEAGTSVEKLKDDIYTNVSQADLPIFQILPIKMKKLFLKIGGGLFGERLFTTPFSNVGIIDLPPQVAAHVKKAGMLISQTQLNTLYSTGVSYNGTFYWQLTSVVEKRRIEDAVADVLTEAGIAFVREER